MCTLTRWIKCHSAKTHFRREARIERVSPIFVLDPHPDRKPCPFPFPIKPSPTSLSQALPPPPLPSVYRYLARGSAERSQGYLVPSLTATTTRPTLVDDAPNRSSTTVTSTHVNSPVLSVDVMLFHPVTLNQPLPAPATRSSQKQLSPTIPHIAYACLGGFVVVVSSSDVSFRFGPK